MLVHPSLALRACIDTSKSSNAFIMKSFLDFLIFAFVLICISLLFEWNCALAQSPATVGSTLVNASQLATDYANAREAYRAQDWSKASSLFRQVANGCEGSKLCLESNYHAILADAHAGNTNLPESIDRWIVEAKKIQHQSKDENSKRQILGWIRNVQLLHAQSDVATNQLDQAEARLRSLVAGPDRSDDESQSTEPSRTAAIWLQLGNLLLLKNTSIDEARSCFEKAILAFEPGHDPSFQAQLGLAACDIQQQKPSVGERLESLTRIARTADEKASIVIQMSRWNEISQPDEAQRATLVAYALEVAERGAKDAELQYELALVLERLNRMDVGTPLFQDYVRQKKGNERAMDAHVRIARWHFDREEWQDVIRSCDDALNSGDSRMHTCHARTLKAKALVHQGLFAEAVGELEKGLELSSDLSMETSIRFELSECLYALQRWDAAKVQWDQLIQIAANSQTSEKNPAWMSTVLLRQAEVLANQKSWDRAESIVSEINTKFPECARRREVDYLLARCWISKARFEEARELLERVAVSNSVDNDVLAWRAWWMIGETHLMQRNYDAAIRAYQSVIDAGSAGYWRSAAQMQLGQCYELMGDRDSATTHYKQVLDDDRTGPFAVTARDRIAELLRQTKASKTAVEVTPGTRK